MPSDPKNAAAGEVREWRARYADIHNVLVDYRAAVHALSERPPGRDDTYFEAPLLATDDGVERWKELDRAGKAVKAALGALNPFEALATPPDPAASQGQAGLYAHMVEVAKANGFDSITDAITQAVAARRPSTEAEVAIKKAADQFAFYADEHAKKGTPESDAKAATNMAWARFCASYGREPVSDTAGEALPFKPEEQRFACALEPDGRGGFSVRGPAAAPHAPATGAAEGLTAEELTAAEVESLLWARDMARNKASGLFTGHEGEGRWQRRRDALERLLAARRSSTDGQGGVVEPKP